MNVALVLPETPSSFSCCCNFWKKQSNKEQPAAERFPQQTYLRPQTFRQKKRNWGNRLFTPKMAHKDMKTVRRKKPQKRPEHWCFRVCFVVCSKDEFKTTRRPVFWFALCLLERWVFFHHLCANEQIHSYRRFWMRPPVWIKNRSLL